MAKEIGYDRILTDRLLDMSKRKKYLKKFNGTKNFYLLEFVERIEKKYSKK